MSSSHTYRLILLTDTHLFASAEERLYGIDTGDSLRRVVEQLMREQPRIDLLLASGDISHDGSAASYHRFQALTAPIAAPLRWVAGNHDDPRIMREIGAEQHCSDSCIDLGNWRISLLDSAAADEVSGFLSQEQLERLEQNLSDPRIEHHLLCLHHHPSPIGSLWMDEIGLRNAEALLAMLARYPQVRAVLFGHTHQASDRYCAGLRLLGTPSTCVQFQAGSDQFRIDTQPPGYRWLQLYADGRLETGVSRLSA